MTDTYDVWKALKSKAEADGLTIQTGSGLADVTRTSKLIRAVRDCLDASGYDGSIENAEKVLLNSTPNLVKSWHAYPLEAKRAVERFFKVDPTGISPRGSSGSDPNPDPSGSSGQGGQGTRQGSASGQGQGSGGSGQAGDEGDGEGDPQQGQGGGESGEGEGEPQQGEGQGQGQGEGQGQGQSEPQPPVPQPEDPTYIKPQIWDKVMRIIIWNMEHPGKQKNIMLVGPRGIGKTEMVIQINKSLASVYPNMQKHPFMITSPQAKHEVAGYGNAMGEAVQTEFTKGYVQQSIVLVEEIDRSEATALIALNAAMANKIMDTPVIGMIEQHPLCTIIATANTAGVGATEEYITANQLDASTRDRFIYISMEFDEGIATKIAKGDKQLVKFIAKWNTACEKCGLIQNTCSYRAITDIKDLLGMGFTLREALENAVLKAAVPKDNLRSVLDKMGAMSANPYFSAMQMVQEAMPDTGLY